MLGDNGYIKEADETQIWERYKDSNKFPVTRIFTRNPDGTQGNIKTESYYDITGRHIRNSWDTHYFYSQYMDIYGKPVKKLMRLNDGIVQVTFYVNDSDTTTYKGIETSDPDVYPQCSKCPPPPINTYYDDIYGRRYSRNTYFNDMYVKTINETYWDKHGYQVRRVFAADINGLQGPILEEHYCDHILLSIHKTFNRDGSNKTSYSDGEQKSIIKTTFKDGTVRVMYEYIKTPEGYAKVIYEGPETSDPNVYPQCPPLPPAPKPHPNFKQI